MAWVSLKVSLESGACADRTSLLKFSKSIPAPLLGSSPKGASHVGHDCASNSWMYS